MAIKYINIFRYKIYPNWDFWSEKKPSGNADRDFDLISTMSFSGSQRRQPASRTQVSLLPAGR
jgi:hypothetical protein